MAIVYHLRTTVHSLFKIELLSVANWSVFQNQIAYPLRAIAAFMHHGNNSITIRKQITVTLPLITL